MQFGVNIRSAPSGEEFLRLVRRTDELGYDVLAAPNHLGAPSPFAMLAAATVGSGHADIVGFAGLRQVKGGPPGTFTVIGREPEAAAADMAAASRACPRRRFSISRSLCWPAMPTGPQTSCGSAIGGTASTA